DGRRDLASDCGRRPRLAVAAAAPDRPHRSGAGAGRLRGAVHALGLAARLLRVGDPGHLADALDTGRHLRARLHARRPDRVGAGYWPALAVIAGLLVLHRHPRNAAAAAALVP